MSDGVEANLVRAAEAIRDAGALIITAGAGMGVDSGLPDFRGPQGFWRAYPAFATLGLRFEELANPDWFASDPELAWGFYGHRMATYRQTSPHEGFDILRRWSATREHFVFTSNVDGHFQKAGFDLRAVVECHGSLNHLQCARPCHEAIWPAEDVAIDVDGDSCRARGELPKCPRCGGLARPNVLMFGDGGWLSGRTDEQEWNFRSFLSGLVDVRRKVVVIELGAGLNVPTVRRVSENLAVEIGATLVRINPRDAEVPRGQVSIPIGSLAALRRIDENLNRKAAGW